ncbi:anti-sigma regulatory factor (Ser/Thr protein kinase) [Thermocatellispora tengchongensis]|uniref:Anti-sigma regulatory factor (Ser/Thr protein kinase) n=1 Tax=Thermocatellispora tengchongensis TaxID=1073253 RepID=A0A840PIU8_9ACTN|nr:ATP-binding protein [Thermocatellispora tengchongensis]MBB5138796.1 anti-sigma regulatory factor (Ser/Thr protein kinase) [Thermocatellispora tengchongensis]
MPVTVSTCVLDGTPSAPHACRAFVSTALAAHPRLDDLALIASELVANSVRHSFSRLPGGRVSVRVIEGAGCDGTAFAGVKVTDDGSSTRPLVRRRVELSESGYGLALVAALADRWGHYSVDNKRTVWAAVRT